MRSLRVAGAAVLLVVVLSGCVPAAGCPWTVGESLLQNSWQTYEACRR